MRALTHIICAAALLCAGPAVAQTAPGPEAYGRLPAISDAAISPDGRHLAIAIASADQTALRILDLSNMSAVQTLAASEGAKLRGVSWADDEHAVFYSSQSMNATDVVPDWVRLGGLRVLEYWRTGIMTISTGRWRYVQLDDDDQWAHINLAGLRGPIETDPGGGRMVSIRSLQDPRQTVFRIDLERGSGRPVMSAGQETDRIILNDRGTIGARVDSDERSNHWRIFQYGADSQPHLILEGDSDTGQGPDVEGFLDDGRLVIVDGREQRLRVSAINADGAREVLAEHETYDVDNTILDPTTHHVVGARWTEDFPRQRFFDPALQAVYERMQSQFAGSYATLESWSRDKTKILVWAETDHDGGAYYIFDTAANALRMVTRAYPELTTVAALGNRQTITYRARDGVRIPAYLTTPATGEARGLPLILLVHGGPHARDNFGFDWWASYLAAHGYAVLQPNYRGSTGYGYDWFNSGRGAWGDGVMQTDVEDGVAAIVRSGIADPDRICIVGASYGGYAALAGATLTPDAYDCAVSVAGVSDVVRMLDDTTRQSGGSQSTISDWWRLSIGDRRSDREHLRNISPINHAADVHIPILLVHGRDDTTVPIIQSRTMRDRLQAAGKNVRYVELVGDDHHLSRAETRTQMLREIDTFLAQNLHPGSVHVDDSGAPPAAAPH